MACEPSPPIHGTDAMLALPIPVSACACEPSRVIESGLRSIHTLLDAPGVRGKTVKMSPEYTSTDVMESIIYNYQKTKDPFYVLDLGMLKTLMDNWTRNLPMIRPFYAVKCNPDPSIVGALAALGANFDCASKAEIESVLSLGVSPDQIIYANPCKPESHIKYAASVGVNLTTFDSKDEVEKIKKWHPKCALLIRVKAPDEDGASIQFGFKYGALPGEITPLLRAAQAAQLSVIGASFHVGTKAKHPHTYEKAIAAVRSVFDTAVGLGMPPLHVVNIGGGFTAGPAFKNASSAVKSGLRAHFRNEPGLVVMAEPGRYFAELVFTLATNIIGKRVRGEEVREYWINDGIYGFMNCVVFDYAALTCMPLACASNHVNSTCDGAATFRCTVFGPTCDSLVTVLKDYRLPELEVGDWLVFPKMGAYTAAAGSSFNGFKTSEILTYVAYSKP